MSAVNAVALLAAAGGDYQISRSVRLRSSASAYFNRTPASAGNRRTWTWSGWVKRGTLSAIQNLMSSDVGTVNATWGEFGFDASDRIYLGFYSGTRYTNAVFRDPSAWYHIVIAFDTTQSTEVDRLKVYVNGIQQTQTGDAGFPALNTDYGINNNQAHGIGYRNWSTPGRYFDGYLTEINFIDGQALTPSSFGETDVFTGVWKPKRYAGTYGTNGFYLNFSDPSAATATAIGKDYSGNNNNWTPNNISVTSGVTYDSMLDVPTQWADGGNGRGNYCVLNPLDFTTVGTISEANLRFTQSSSAARSGRASIGVSSGKWYWEVINLGGNNSFGVQNATASLGTYCGGDANGWSYFIDGNKYNNNTATSYGASYTTNDVIGIALDMDAGTLTFYKNGTSQGTAFSSLSGTLFPAFSTSSVSSVTFAANFGQRPFAYTPPTGFRALNTQNLPAPSILKGNLWFDVSLYTGNGSTQTVTNSGGFTPDLVWHKGRSVAYSHSLVDAVRGNSNVLYSNTTDAEANPGAQLDITTNGFISTYRVANLANNQNAATYVAWQWKESATAGFDIVTYTTTGSVLTVAHSLGVAPRMIITKQRNGTTAWYTYHASIGATNSVLLNSTAAQAASSAIWNNTAPTSSVFTVGSGFGAGETYVAYLFAEVAGFSRFGSYTGNGSTDGPFVFCGFRPRYVLIKVSSGTTGSWVVYDTSRSTYNATGLYLVPNLSNAEAGPAIIDIDVLSNGFKIRQVDGAYNANACTYIFAAFAEHPFKNALAR